MSEKEIKSLSKSEIKRKLVQMGVRLDKKEHPKEYYVELYLKKSKSKKKDDKTKAMKGKRKRGEIKNILDDPKYEEEEYEEGDEISDDEDKKKRKKPKIKYTNILDDPKYEEEEYEEGDEISDDEDKKKRNKFKKKKVDKNKKNKKEESKKLNELKTKVLENQKKLREKKEVKTSIASSEKQTNAKVNEVLEDMFIYGTVIKKEIKEEKAKNPKKYISTNEALKQESNDQGLFALGLLSKNLEDIGIETIIEKKENIEEMDSDVTSMQFITNGMCQKKRYDLHFDFGEERNEELLKDKKEYETFKNNLKLKLSKDYNIPVDKIIVTFPQAGSFSVQVIFQSDEFNDLDINQLKKKFKNEKQFKELSNLKEIHTDVIMGGCKLTKNQLDSRGNRTEGWGVGEKRGGKPYDPPLGWTGIGLRVLDKYGDNTWIGMNNSEGEWCVAYHGVGSGQSSNDVKSVTGKIFKGSFKPGWRQAHKDCPDQFHPGKTVGSGVYCTPKISTAEDYAGISDINGKSYKTVLMVRVKPDAIRHCDICSDSKEPYNYWVVNGTTDEIRPYRILYKC